MTALLIFGIYIILVWTQIDAEEASSEFTLKVLSTVAPLLLFPLYYVRSFFAATKDLFVENDRERSRVEGELQAAKQLRADLRIEITFSMHGGAMQHDPSETCVILFLMVKNVGSLPSAAINWRMWVEHEGQRHWLPIVHMPRPITLGNMFGGPAIVAKPEDAIYNKTQQPILPGAIISGFIGAFFKVGAFPGIDDGANFGCMAEQVDGRLVEGERAEDSELITSARYLPGLNLDYVKDDPDAA